MKTSTQIPTQFLNSRYQTENMDDLGITFPAKVTRVLDGDTIEVEVRKTMRIRLLDCWAPETRTRNLEEKEYGLLAKKELEELLEETTVRVEVPIGAENKFGDSMSMGRVLGHVQKGDLDIAKEMVHRGLAVTEKTDWDELKTQLDSQRKNYIEESSIK